MGRWRRRLVAKLCERQGHRLHDYAQPGAVRLPNGQAVLIYATCACGAKKKTQELPS